MAELNNKQTTSFSTKLNNGFGNIKSFSKKLMLNTSKGAIKYGTAGFALGYTVAAIPAIIYIAGSLIEGKPNIDVNAALGFMFKTSLQAVAISSVAGGLKGIYSTLKKKPMYLLGETAGI